MKRLIVDASVAIKWVVDEVDSAVAVALLDRFPMAAPDLLVAECANILWKKARRGELSADEAVTAARILQHADLEILPTRHLMDQATQLAIDLDHAAYDCVYLVLAMHNGWQLVTADDQLRRKLAQTSSAGNRKTLAISLQQAMSSRSRSLRRRNS